MEKERTITVKGVGSLNLKADFIKIAIYLDEKSKDYQEGYANFTKHINELQNSIIKAGFNKSDLRTSSIDIKADYDTVKKNGSYVRVLLGYQYFTKMIISFDIDSEKFNNILSKVYESGINAELKIEYTIKDKETAKNELLSRASKDAKIKAKALCEGMDVKLGKLISIVYNLKDDDFTSTYKKYGLAKSVTIETDVDITPNDIYVEDGACFIWEIID